MSRIPPAVIILPLLAVVAVLFLHRLDVKPPSADEEEAIGRTSRREVAARSRRRLKLPRRLPRSGDTEARQEESPPRTKQDKKHRDEGEAVRNAEGSEPLGGEFAFSVDFDGSATGSDGTVPLTEEGVRYDRRSGAARLPPEARIVYPDAGGIDPNEGAVAFWIRREWDAEEQYGRTLLELRTETWENRLELGLGSEYLRFMLTAADGIETAVGTGISWYADEWHHVAISWGQALIALYVDGELKEQRTYADVLQVPDGTALYVGASRLPTDFSPGTIALDEFVVLRHQPDHEEINAILAATAEPY